MAKIEEINIHLDQEQNLEIEQKQTINLLSCQEWEELFESEFPLSSSQARALGRVNKESYREDNGRLGAFASCYVLKEVTLIFEEAARQKFYKPGYFAGKEVVVFGVGDNGWDLRHAHQLSLLGIETIAIDQTASGNKVARKILKKVDSILPIEDRVKRMDILEMLAILLSSQHIMAQIIRLLQHLPEDVVYAAMNLLGKWLASDPLLRAVIGTVFRSEEGNEYCSPGENVKCEWTKTIPHPLPFLLGAASEGAGRPVVLARPIEKCPYQLETYTFLTLACPHL